MAKKQISLIVLNYDGKKHLKEYFESIFEQTLLPDEIFLMDNASSDGSVKYVQRKFTRVKIIKNNFNAGTAEGSNIAFKHSKGNYVIFQSNDIKLDKNCVKILVDAMESDKKIGIATSVLLKYDKDKPRSNRGKKTEEHLIDNAGGIADIYGFGMQKYPGESIDNIPEQQEVFFSYGGSFIIRREIFKKIGGFDRRFFTLNDDIDLSWRVRLLGYKIVYNKKSIVYHKMSATLGPLFQRPLKRYWSERNIMRTLLKNYQMTDLITKFPIYIILLFGEMGYFLLRRKFSLFFADTKALLWNILYLPDTLRERKKIQSAKKEGSSVEKLLVKKSLKLKLFSDFNRAL